MLEDLKTSVGLRYETNNKNDDKRKQLARKDQLKRRQFSETLCIPEWMIEIPNDLKENWVFIPRPDGKRYILTSKNGKSTLRDIYGYSKDIKTNLPGGAANYRGNSIFDVILTNSCIYIMDILYFNNVDYGESEVQSRLFTIQSRISEDNYWVDLNNKQYIVTNPPFYECTYDNLISVYTQFADYPLNGLLFLQKYGRINEGNDPLQLLWKDQKTATYFINTDKDGKILEYQELHYINHSIQTLEGLVLCPCDLHGVEDDVFIRCMIQGIQRTSDGQWQILNIQPKGMASVVKTLADSISKIVFQEMARTQPISFEQLLQCLS